MGSNTTAKDTNTSLPKKDGKLLPHSEQAVACHSLTKPEKPLFDFSDYPDKEETIKVLSSIVYAFMSEPFIAGEMVRMSLARAAKLAQQVGVDEVHWEKMFTRINEARKAWHKQTGFADFMG